MVHESLKKLIDEHIETVKENNTYYTYCTLWDNPMQTHKPFPNEAVGVGKTKQESIDEFMKFEQKRQDLIDTINERLLGMKL